jgi:hypothetical protein
MRVLHEYGTGGAIAAADSKGLPIDGWEVLALGSGWSVAAQSSTVKPTFTVT